MNTIRAGWLTFVEHIVPTEATRVRRMEAQRAFYAGAGHLLDLVAQIGDDDCSQEEGVARLESFRSELAAFLRDVKARRA